MVFSYLSTHSFFMYLVWKSIFICSFYRTKPFQYTSFVQYWWLTFIFSPHSFSSYSFLTMLYLIHVLSNSFPLHWSYFYVYPDCVPYNILGRSTVLFRAMFAYFYVHSSLEFSTHYKFISIGISPIGSQLYFKKNWKRGLFTDTGNFVQWYLNYISIWLCFTGFSRPLLALIIFPNNGKTSIIPNIFHYCII